MKALVYILYPLDYVFYRAYHYYKNKEDSTPFFSAVCIVSVLCSFSLLSIFILFAILFHIETPDIAKWQTILFALCILGIITYRYIKVPITKLNLRWKNEILATKIMRGWLIFFVLIGELLFIIISSYIRHNVYGDAKFFG